MAIELNFSKSDNKTSWGFRLTGGVDYDQPLVVVKVNENSLAEELGLQVGDIIVRINDTSTAGLTHAEAHDLLQSAGNEFVLGVRRNSEDEKILEHEAHLEVVLSNTSTTEESQNIQETKTSSSQILTETVDTMVYNRNIASDVDEVDRKWSTFLQRPNNPKPKKKEIEEEKDTVAPYRVVITKQRKRPNKKHVEFKEGAAEEIVLQTEASEMVETSGCQMQVEVELKVEEREDIEIEIEEVESEEEVVDESYVEEVEEEETFVSKSATSTSRNMSETSLSLEEQLAQVQKQLQALSQLPSTIQVTLDAVTQQLAKIVTAKYNQNGDGQGPNEEENSVEEEDGVIEQQTTEELLEESDGSVNAENAERDISISKEDNEEEGSLKEVEANEEDSRMEETQDPDLEAEPEDPDAGLTEEEKEAKRLEEQKVAKKQKAMEQQEEFMQRRLEQRPTQPLKPIQRPIILPGGRRWSQPEDAISKARNPKMSDEKIADTIETYSEVIVGKAKGESNCFMVPSKVMLTKSINFLKYQPPPKNLDYLQRSEVYRLVHDMEPPVRGISTRAEKILSAQDYYEPNEAL